MSDALTDEWFKEPYDIWFAEAVRIGAYIGPDVLVTRWKTATCSPYKCVLNISTDGVKVRIVDSKGKTNEIFMPNTQRPKPPRAESVFVCPFHKKSNQHYVDVIKESRLVTGFLDLLRTQKIELFEQNRLLTGYKWSFDNERNLVVNIHEFPEEVKISVRALISDIRFEGRLRING